MSEPIGSPSNIEVLLHCHTSPVPHPRREAGAVQQALGQLLALGAIEGADSPGVYRTTRLGEAWVEALCRVPVPRFAYLDEQGREL